MAFGSVIKESAGRAVHLLGIAKAAAIELIGPRTGQQIEFQRFEPGTVSIAPIFTTIAIPWPVELPR